jgi:hypothetical protein
VLTVSKQYWRLEHSRKPFGQQVEGLNTRIPEALDRLIEITAVGCFWHRALRAAV